MCALLCNTLSRPFGHRIDPALDPLRYGRRSRARARGASQRGANGPACTPGSVRGREPRGRSSLSATRCRAAPAAYPRTRRAASASSVWPCSGRGLPCGPCHHDPGGLLHRRFTLTGVAPGGLFSVALSRGSLRVGVTHRPALWSPDVPRREQTRDATVQPTHSLLECIAGPAGAPGVRTWPPSG